MRHSDIIPFSFVGIKEWLMLSFVAGDWLKMRNP